MPHPLHAHSLASSLLSVAAWRGIRNRKGISLLSIPFATCAGKKQAYSPRAESLAYSFALYKRWSLCQIGPNKNSQLRKPLKRTITMFAPSWISPLRQPGGGLGES